MPQGVVIAVRPLGFEDNPDLAFTLNTESYSTSNTGKGPKELVYIKMYGQHQVPGNPHHAEERVFWFIDEQGIWFEDLPVNFTINHGRTRQIKQAIDVSIIKKWPPYFRGRILSKVALLTSFVLLAAVALDSRTSRK